MSRAMVPRISVIIATRDRAAVLEQCLRHILAQSSDQPEVLVIDNSVDQQSTVTVVGRFLGVRYLRADPASRNPALLRNIGIRSSHGEILAFIDDDALVDLDWLQGIQKGFADPQIDGVTGRVIEADAPVVCTTEIGRFSPRGEIMMNFNNVIDHRVPVEFLYGCNMALRRSTLQKVGLYDTWFGITYEETDLSFRIRESGGRLMFVPDMIVQHLKAPRPSGIVQRSDNFDLRSSYMRCRALAYLCVSHFGFRRDFAKVAFVNLPKGAARSLVEHPSVNNMLKVPIVLTGGFAGYAMAVARRTGAHRPPSETAAPIPA